LVDVAKAFLNAGTLSRPPSFTGLHPSDFWAWIRYYSALTPGPDLHLDAAWRHLDPHQKTILSDDWGVGFTTSVIGDALGIVGWTHTLEAMKRIGHGASFVHRPKTGLGKSPDFIGTDPAGKFVILECKGTQTSKAELNKQLRSGIDQKRNVLLANPGDIRERLAAGIFVSRSGHRSTMRIVDPVGEEGAVVDPEQLSEAILEANMAALLACFGAPAWLDILQLPSNERRELTARERRNLRLHERQRRQYVVPGTGVRREQNLTVTAWFSEDLVTHSSQVIAAALSGASVNEARTMKDGSRKTWGSMTITET
jgi:hypothetical protein